VQKNILIIIPGSRTCWSWSSNRSVNRYTVNRYLGCSFQSGTQHVDNRIANIWRETATTKCRQVPTTTHFGPSPYVTVDNDAGARVMDAGMTQVRADGRTVQGWCGR